MPRKKQKKDFSPKPASRFRIKFTTKDSKLISEVAKIHGFDVRRLSKSTLNIADSMSLLDASSKQIPSSAEKKRAINELLQVSEECFNSFGSKSLGSLIAREIDEHAKKFFRSNDTSFTDHLERKLQFILDHLTKTFLREKIGDFVCNTLINNSSAILKCLKKAGLQIKIELCVEIQKKCDSSDFLKSINSDLTELIKQCRCLHGKAIKQGRPFKIFLKNLILMLMSLYEEGTGKKPTTNWSDHSESDYSGNFYGFIVDFFPLLKRYFLTENCTIKKVAKAAREILPHYKKLREMQQT